MNSKIEEQINQYIINGGRLFTIVSINSLRDGGTRVIKTSNQTFYVDKNNEEKYFSFYPIEEENEIKDPLQKIYLKERIESYFKRLEQDTKFNKNFFKIK